MCSVSVRAVSLFRDGECSAVDSGAACILVTPIPKGLTLRPPLRSSRLLTRSRREVPEAFLSPHTCGSQTPQSLSRLSRLRDFATLRVEKQSPRSGPLSTDQREVVHTRPFSIAVCQAAKDGFLRWCSHLWVFSPRSPLVLRPFAPFFAGQQRATGTWSPAWRCSLPLLGGASS